MRKLKSLLLAVILTFTFCACSSPEPDETETLYNEERVEYNVDSFSVSMYEGNVYIDQYLEEKDSYVISVFDGTGEKLRDIELKNSPPGEYDIIDGKMYGICDKWDYSEEVGGYAPSTMILSSIDLETGESEEICDLANTISSIYKVRVLGDKLYWLGNKKNAVEFYDSFLTGEGELIDYGGLEKAFGYVDLKTGEITESDVSHPVAFSERNGHIYLYIYEGSKGYQFYDYTAGAVISETNKLQSIGDFEIINDNADFVFVKSNPKSAYVDTLSFTGMDGKSGIIQLDDEIFPVRLSAEGDYLCVSGKNSVNESENYKLYKYYVGNVSTENPPIRIITDSDVVKNYPLFSCGFQIKTDELSQNSFSLTVLSLDKKYDMVMLDSSERCADEIRNKGSFYPLNDIPGVKEYIDGCFPGIKEAATDENGDIWMLPVSVDVPTIRYNVKNCEEKGISFSSDLSDFINNIDKASDYTQYFYCNRYSVIQSMLTSYLSENDSFNTDTFRGFAEIIRKNYFNRAIRNDGSKVSSAFYNKTMMDNYGRGLLDTALYEEIYDNALFALTPYLSDQKHSLGDRNLLAAPIPTINGVSSAYCTFICVNPNSEHLKDVLLFIEKTASRFAGKKNGFTVTDRSLYDSDPYTQSLYDVYANSRISFTMPWEIYQDDFESYGKGIIELEDFIAEADRKLSAYLNE